VRLYKILTAKKACKNNTVHTLIVRKNLWLGLDNGIAFVNEKNSPLHFDIIWVYMVYAPFIWYFR
jgi:hypothetical protein